MPDKPVVIVGAGWAGLAAAVELSAGNMPVILLESARQPGGRARSVRFDNMTVDNGQHLIIGAYQSLLSLMDRLNVDVESAFRRQPIRLRLVEGTQTSLQLAAPRLPAPYHLLAAIMTARGLSVVDRLRALRFGRRLRGLVIPGDSDISVQALLHSEVQTPAAIHKLWEPLCIAALNTPAGQASARVFINVLRESFLHHARHSDLLIPRMELSDILPRPCISYLEQRAGRIELEQRVTALDIKDSRLCAVYVGKRRIEAGHAVLATQHVVSRRLMSHHDILNPECARLSRLGNEPVATLYLKYPVDVSLPGALTGLGNGPGQWVFDRRTCGQPGLMAVVISTHGPHTLMPSDELTEAITDQLAASFPDWPRPLESRLIREKRATFTCSVGIDSHRPGNSTGVSNLWLAGDYTVSGLPATLESAVRSGIHCAAAIMNSPLN